MGAPSTPYLFLPLIMPRSNSTEAQPQAQEPVSLPWLLEVNDALTTTTAGMNTLRNLQDQIVDLANLERQADLARKAIELDLPACLAAEKAEAQRLLNAPRARVLSFDHWDGMAAFDAGVDPQPVGLSGTGDRPAPAWVASMSLRQAIKHHQGVAASALTTQRETLALHATETIRLLPAVCGVAEEIFKHRLVTGADAFNSTDLDIKKAVEAHLKLRQKWLMVLGRGPIPQDLSQCLQIMAHAGGPFSTPTALVTRDLTGAEPSQALSQVALDVLVAQAQRIGVVQSPPIQQRAFDIFSDRAAHKKSGNAAQEPATGAVHFSHSSRVWRKP